MSPTISVGNQRRRAFFSYTALGFHEEVDLVSEAMQGTINDPKAICLQGRLLSARDSVQPNWGRVQAEARKQYSFTFQRPTIRSRVVPRATKYVRPFGGSGARSKPRVNDNQAIQDALGEIMVAIGAVPLRQLAPELHEASDLQEKVALVRSWVDQLEEHVRHSRKGPSQTMTEAVVLERFEGFVDQIDGPTAYVTLKSQFGDVLLGEYSADDLAGKGITEGRRFRCETVEVDGAVRVLFESLPDEPVTEDEEDAIRHRIGELLQDDELDGDY